MTDATIVSIDGTEQSEQPEDCQVEVIEFINEFDKHFVDRRSEIVAIMAAFLAKEHVFILGPPGTAKSMLARAIAKALGKTYFEYLVSKTTLPDEVLGPYSVTKLMNDEFYRKTEGYLPTCEVVLLDEVWKCNHALLNTLLCVVNERKFHNGLVVEDVPLETMITASNELPEDDTLNAIYDRFMVRLNVKWAGDPADRKRIVFGPAPNPQCTLSSKSLEELRSKVAAFLENDNDEFEDALIEISEALKNEGLEYSDRRWRQTVPILAAHSVLSGYGKLEVESFEILADLLWGKPEDKPTIVRVVSKIANPVLNEVQELYDAAKELVSQLPNPKESRAEFLDGGSTILEQLENIGKQASVISSRQDRVSGSVDTLIGGIRQMWTDLQERLNHEIFRGRGLD